MELNTAVDAKLPFQNINPKQVNCRFEGVNYAVKTLKGSFSKPADGGVMRVIPQMNVVEFNLADIKR